MTIELTVLISVVSISIAVITFFRNGKKDTKDDVKEDATQMATVITELKSISNGIEDIKKEITSIKDDVKENRDRTTRVDESCKQAHKRIDELVSRLEHLSGKEVK